MALISGPLWAYRGRSWPLTAPHRSSSPPLAPGHSWQVQSSRACRWRCSASLCSSTPSDSSGSFAVAGLVCSAYAICGAISAPVLGRLVDRRGQTRVLIGGAVLTATALIGVGLLPVGTPPTVLIAIAGCAGVSTPPLEPCVRTLLPKIAVHPSDLPGLFALESTVLELTFVFGPPLALGLGAAWSTGAALVTSGLVMVVATAAFTLQPASRSWRPQARATRRTAGSLQSTAIRVLVALDLGTGIVFGATEVGVTATAKHLAAAAAAAPILALWGLGSLLGGVAMTRIGGGAKTDSGSRRADAHACRHPRRSAAGH